MSTPSSTCALTTLEHWHAPEIVPYESSLEHLETLIQRLADLVAAHIARVPEDRRYRRGTRADYLEFATSFGAGEIPALTKRLWGAADQKLKWIRAREAITEIPLPFRRLADSFGLSQAEQDVLMFVAAPRIDPHYSAHFGSFDRDYISPDVGAVIAALSRRFEDSVAMRRIFSLKAPLIANSLLLAEVHGQGEGDFLSVGLEVPRRVIGELLGQSHVAEELVAFSRLRTPCTPLDHVVLPQETKELVLSLVRNHDAFLERRERWGIDDVITYGKALVMLFAGPPGTGKTMLANAVATTVGKRLFCVDAAKLLQTGRSIEANLEAIFREVKLLDAVLFFDECEQIFLDRRRGNEIMPMLLDRLEQYDGVTILATNMENTLDEALARRIVARIGFTAPTCSARAEIWRKHLPSSLPLDSDVDIERLADRYEMTGGYIKNAVLTAVLRSVSRQAESVSMADLEHGAKLQIRITNDELLRVERPEVRLHDVVVPQEVRQRIERFVAAARARTTVLTEWGFGKSLGTQNGLTALLSGPPGTGKSMASEAIACELERPLMRCQLSSIISKWVGETSKNLDSLFQTAREHGAVIVFDEAEALFSRRTMVRTSNDRFANAETGALLTQIERHPGVVILTTNLPEAIDQAFERRIHLRVAFPFPDAAARARIWRKMLPADAPLDEDVDVTKLARRFELSGGLIRNAVLASALEAAAMPASQRRITQAMLERAAAEQLGQEWNDYELLSNGPLGSA